MEYTFRSTIQWQLTFENFEKSKSVTLLDSKGQPLDSSQSKMNNNKMTLIEGTSTGIFKVIAEI